MVWDSTLSADNKFTFFHSHFDLYFVSDNLMYYRNGACFVGLMLRVYCANYPLHLTQSIRLNAAVSPFWLLTRRNSAFNSHDRITAKFLLECCYFSFPMALRPNSAHSHLILDYLDHTKRPNTVDRTSLEK